MEKNNDSLHKGNTRPDGNKPKKAAGTAKKAAVRKKSRSSKRAKKTANIFTKFTFKIAMYITGALIIVFVCGKAYGFGRDVFSDKGVDEAGEGHEVVITIPVNASIGEVGEILKKNGLIESELVFRIQTIIYEADIHSGTYTLNTEWGPEKLIEGMKPVENEKQQR